MGLHQFFWIGMFQHHLLKRLSFFHCITFDPLSKISLLYLCRSVSGLFCSIDLFHQYHTSFILPIPYRLMILSLSIHEHGISAFIYQSSFSSYRSCTSCQIYTTYFISGAGGERKWFCFKFQILLVYCWYTGKQLTFVYPSCVPCNLAIIAS